jgi:murein DD-endopeptidase MepM/ murein hydrolase activator NlpD
LGDGQFAHYCHLQPGSLRVKPGDHVRRGDVLARIGVSGDPNVPHLHFEVTTSAKPLVGEGIPYVIDQFRVQTPDGLWKPITRELPSRNMLVDFGK